MESLRYAPFFALTLLSILKWEFQSNFKQWPLVFKRRYLRCHVESSPSIGHEFQNLSLSNRGYVQNLSFENEFFFFLMRIKSFHVNSFALTLALKWSLEQLGICLLTKEGIWPKICRSSKIPHPDKIIKKELYKNYNKKKRIKRSQRGNARNVSLSSFSLWHVEMATATSSLIKLNFIFPSILTH